MLIVGGRGTGASINPTAAAELVDPATNTFTSPGNMNAPLSEHSATLLENEKC